MKRRRNSSHDLDKRMVAVLEVVEPNYIKTADVYGATFQQLVAYAQQWITHKGDAYGEGQVFEYDGKDYVVATDDEAVIEAENYIKEGLWSFRSSFLEYYVGIPERAIAAIQESMYEEANDVFLELLNAKGNLQRLINDAVASDGLDRYLNYGDIEDEVSVQGDWFYVWVQE